MNRQRMTCTVCKTVTDEVLQHKLLKVIICKHCMDKYQPDLVESGEACIWCLHRDGDLLPCVQCTLKCCYECMNANLGHDYMNFLNEKNWICFVCDPSPIEELQRACLLLRNPLIPERASSSIDISSPFVAMDEADENIQKPPRQAIPSSTHDLDYILQMYGKQIAASLKFEDANVPAIIKEINSISIEEMVPAIRSLRKCLSAFSSDLTNLESRLLHATAIGSQETLSKLVSLLSILIQHHIFNRLAHPKARIRDDLSNKKRDRQEKSLVVFPSANGDTNGGAGDTNNQKMVLIMDQEWLKDPKKLKMTVEKVAIDLSRPRKQSNGKASSDNLSISDITRIIDSYAKKDTQSSADPISSSNTSESSTNRKIDRNRRSLISPSWLSDFKIETDEQIDDGDYEWTISETNRQSDLSSRKRGRPPKNSFSLKSDTSTKKIEQEGAKRGRGRPPKYPFTLKSEPSTEQINGDEHSQRARGRPKKSHSLNEVQPRFYVPKLNGSTLNTL